jgi:dipeptidyl aminopeptidase/acylaminoacyl peptidase
LRTPAFFLLLAISITGAEVKIRSTKDGTQQPSLLEIPEAAKTGAPVPLLVHLHSWSADYKNSGLMSEAQQGARDRGWVFLSPNFRGPNNRPEACGSDLATTDVIDAVHYAQSVAHIDPRRIYVVGGSGGGYIALLLAARYPELWAAVSAWVPISDLAAWHASAKAAGLRYDGMLEKCFGGTPATKTAEYKRRSPLFQLSRAKGLRISIHTGIHDGHKGSVPVSHSLLAFNELAKANGLSERMFSEEEIRQITTEEKIPPSLLKTKPVQTEGARFPTLYSRMAGPVTVTIFEGGHATDFPTAVKWLAAQGSRP